MRKEYIGRFRGGCTAFVNARCYVSYNGKLSTLGLVLVKRVTVNGLRRNSRVLIPTGACVTAVLSVADIKLIPVLMRPGPRALRVSRGLVRDGVSCGAENVVLMRLCNGLS